MRLSDANLYQHTTDYDRVLALVLEQTGPVTVDLERLHVPTYDGGLELYTVTPDGPEATAKVTIGVRRRETIGERLTRLLAEAYRNDETTHAEDAERILRALGADPDHPAPREEPTP